MTEIKQFTPYREWQKKYREDKVYTRKDMHDALEKQAKEMTVNRVVRSFNGKYGPDCTEAMQILAIHKTPEGTLVIVK